uniref:Chitinase n=1 Tax=Strongyloides venezuelensis TaxID=75913 RepID=A0A0K0EZJ5_STRVS
MVSNSSNCENRFVNNYSFGWLSKDRDINAATDTYDNLYPTIIDGQPINKDLDSLIILLQYRHVKTNTNKLFFFA